MQSRIMLCFSLWFGAVLCAQDAAHSPPQFVADSSATGQVVATAGNVPVIIQVSPSASSAPAIPTPASAWYWQLTANPVVITAFLTACVYVLKWLQDQKKLDAQRWEGVIVHCFALAEEVGLPGTQKLANALQEFETIFTRVFGVPPSAQDRADATVDFAKIAAASPSAAPAPAKG